MNKFTHLHVHTQYSILDGAAPISKLIDKAKSNGMSALAITDHGYMHGVKLFYDQCRKKGIKPLLGCEVYVAQRGMEFQSEREDRSGRHLILIAKNEKGYRNLLKLSSSAAVDGFYYRPRIDKQILQKYSEGLIVCSACLGGEIPKLIEQGDLRAAKEAVLWFKGVFGDDYYLELQRHRATDPKLRKEISDKQDIANEAILKLSKECGVKVIASNDVHFVDEQDAESHDMLVCLSTGKNYDDENRMRYTQQEWFKTHEEMSELFADIPEAITNTFEVAEKVEEYELNTSPIMPIFPIPEYFASENDYRENYSEELLIEEFGESQYKRLGGYDKVIRIKLESDYLNHISYEGAIRRYGENLPNSHKEQIDFELKVIKEMGFPGYFLITQDFINQAKKMGVLVGPGRGSAAGSVVSYCVGITDIDPIRHKLLFERFLNPDRISMPDVDIDFDDDGRQLILNWVRNKYGHDKVSHICTYGTLAIKSAIKDVARAYGLPLSESNRLTKLVPDQAKNFKEALDLSPELKTEQFSPNPLIAKTIRLAEALEGSVRQTGVHACGVLICRDALTEHIPLMPTKEADGMLTTQYDSHYVEGIGLLKMDFLGLKTLSIIKEALANIKLAKGIEVDIDNIPENDKLTFDLFSKAATTAIFQFESPGMKKHLQNLKPSKFEHLVAMNALYRPGPMEYIPLFLKRRHGEEEVKYDHPLMEPYLNDTYGVTVYQEQVMLQSRELGGFTRGESDSLRKAMGKKNIDVMDKLKEKFINGCLSNPKFMDPLTEEQKQNPQKLIDKIWKDWEAFAQYAFNKSHSVCYAHIAYITGYLKAHYPAEYMAGVLSRNLNDIKRISEFMDECQRMNMKVMGPDVNESYQKFTVNQEGNLRFGLAGVKGLGEGAVEHIIEERKANGPFLDIYDFAKRVSLRIVNKRNWESLALSGAFDNMGLTTRSQFFESENDNPSFIEQLIRYGNAVQEDKNNNANSLFDMFDGAASIKQPIPPVAEPWSRIAELEKEKEMIGIYLSGHPLDEYSLILDHLCKTTMKSLLQIDRKLAGSNFIAGGVVTACRAANTKKGAPYGVLTVEDFSGSYDFFIFGEDYAKFSIYFTVGFAVLIKGQFQANRWKPENSLEIKITSISLLSDMKGQVFNSFRIQLSAPALCDESLNEILVLVENNRTTWKDQTGITMYIDIEEFNENDIVTQVSTSGKIIPNKNLIDSLNNINGVKVRLE